eukprot:g635.t1
MRRRARASSKRRRTERKSKAKLEVKLAEHEKRRPLRKHARESVKVAPLPQRKRQGFILQLLYSIVDDAIDGLVKRDVKLHKLRSRRAKVFDKAREHYYRCLYKVAIEQAAEIARNIHQQRRLELLEGLACHPNHAELLAWAATEVARRYRGRLVRRRLRENPPKKYNKEERVARDAAATTIQALIRGFLARCTIDPIQRMIHRSWSYYDADKDGALNAPEFLAFANSMLTARIYKLDPNEASRFVRFIDKDGDGLVDKKELSKFLSNGIDMDDEEREDFSSRSTTHAKILALCVACQAKAIQGWRVPAPSEE